MRVPRVAPVAFGIVSAMFVVSVSVFVSGIVSAPFRCVFVLVGPRGRIVFPLGSRWLSIFTNLGRRHSTTFAELVIGSFV